MAHPKRKVSRSRRDKRRAQYNAKTKPVIGTECINCGGITFSHRACGKCGYYNGRFVPINDKAKSG